MVLLINLPKYCRTVLVQYSRALLVHYIPPCHEKSCFHPHQLALKKGGRATSLPSARSTSPTPAPARKPCVAPPRRPSRYPVFPPARAHALSEGGQRTPTRGERPTRSPFSSERMFFGGKYRSVSDFGGQFEISGGQVFKISSVGDSVLFSSVQFGIFREVQFSMGFSDCLKAQPK